VTLLRSFTRAIHSIARSLLRQRGWVAGWLGVCHTPVLCLGIVSKRLNLF